MLILSPTPLTIAHHGGLHPTAPPRPTAPELAACTRDDEAVTADGRGWPYEPVDGSPAPPPAAPAIDGPAAVPESVAGPTVSRRAVVLLSIAGALALLLASLGIGDWWVRNREMQTLLNRVERAERAQLPAIQSIGPLLYLCQQEASGDQQQLCDTVAIRQGAERVLPGLQETGDEVGATKLTSFHGGLRTFRDRYVAHNLAWRSWLEELTRDPTAGGFESPDTISTTFQAASSAADDALTPLALHGNRARVEAIFASVR